MCGRTAFVPPFRAELSPMENMRCDTGDRRESAWNVEEPNLAMRAKSDGGAMCSKHLRPSWISAEKIQANPTKSKLVQANRGCGEGDKRNNEAPAGFILEAWMQLPQIGFARAHGMRTYEPRQGRKAATVVCSTSAVVTLAFSIYDFRFTIYALKSLLDGEWRNRNLSLNLNCAWPTR